MIYLYIKQHSITGLKYFGKTTRLNPFKYNGSGVYWNRHIKKYGIQFIQTLEIYGFDNEELCFNFASKFSSDNNIVESDEWANLIPENGFNGLSVGHKLSEEIKKKMSNSAKGKILSKETKVKISNSRKGMKFSDETKQKLSLAAKNKIFTDTHKASLSKAGKGRICTPETRAKLSIIAKNRSKKIT